MQHGSEVSTRGMLRQNRSAQLWCAVTERSRKKNYDFEGVPCLREASGFICLTLETLLVPLTAFWCCHFSVFDVGKIRARPEWSSASLASLVWNLEFFWMRHCSKYAVCIFCCKMGLSNFLHIVVKNVTASVSHHLHFKQQKQFSECVNFFLCVTSVFSAWFT